MTQTKTVSTHRIQIVLDGHLQIVQRKAKPGESFRMVLDNGSYAHDGKWFRLGDIRADDGAGNVTYSLVTVDPPKLRS